MVAQGWMVVKLGGNGKGVIAKRYGVYLLGWSECKIDCDRYKAVNTLKVTEIYTSNYISIKLLHLKNKAESVFNE